MLDLLTLNGVPVTQAGSITIAERDAIMDAFDRDYSVSFRLSETPNAALQPIMRIVDNITRAFAAQLARTGRRG